MANQENIRKWVEALRSGKYQQTRTRLADATGYCCLGVACEAAIANGLPMSKETLDGTVHYEGEISELPYAVIEWLGLGSEPDDDDSVSDSNPPLWSDEGDAFSAAEWNDEHGADFAQIADMIEAKYLTETE